MDEFELGHHDLQIDTTARTIAMHIARQSAEFDEAELMSVAWAVIADLHIDRLLVFIDEPEVQA